MSTLSGASQIKESLTAIARRSKGLYIFFDIVLALYLVATLVLFVLLLIGDGNLPTDGLALFLWSVPLLVTIALGAIIIFVISRIFKEISEHRSPFTTTQARRFNIIGILLIIDTVLEAISSISYPLLADSLSLSIGFTQPGGTEDLYINGPFIIGAVICFCLSYIFRYGALLQQLSDETF